MKVLITDYAWKLMRGYVDECRDEISGLGKVERDENGNFVVTDIAIFRQTVSGAHSDIEAVALAEFQVEMMQKGESMKDWYLWWHSHATMGTFFSGRDTQTIDESTDFGVLLSIVTNHKHEFKARVDVYEPVRLYTDLEVGILEAGNEDIIELCKAEIAKKVSKPVQTYSKWDGKGYGEAGKGWKEDDYEGYGQVRIWDEETKTFRSKVGFHNTKELLPKSVTIEEEDPTDVSDMVAEYEKYMEEKEMLQDEIADAKQANDQSALKVARSLLSEHKRKGMDMGFENDTKVA